MGERREGREGDGKAAGARETGGREGRRRTGRGERGRGKGGEEESRRDGPMSVNEGADGLVHQHLPAVWSDVRHRHAQEIDFLCLSSQEVIALDEIFR